MAHSARIIQQLFLEIWTPMDWMPYLPGLNLADFSICSILQAKVQVVPHTNLSITKEQDPLAAVDIRKTCCSLQQVSQPAAAKRPPSQKMALSLNRWIANNPTHTNQ